MIIDGDAPVSEISGAEMDELVGFIKGMLMRVISDEQNGELK